MMRLTLGLGPARLVMWRPARRYCVSRRRSCRCLAERLYLETPYPTRFVKVVEVTATPHRHCNHYTSPPDAYAIAHNAAPQRRHELEERKGTTPADTGDLDVPYAHSLSLVRSAGRHSDFNMEWRSGQRRGLAEVSAMSWAIMSRGRPINVMPDSTALGLRSRPCK